MGACINKALALVTSMNLNLSLSSTVTTPYLPSGHVHAGLPAKAIYLASQVIPG